jgi:glucose-1-phosphate adenylyltransferase
MPTNRRLLAAMPRVLGIVMAGGRGDRLQPLTRARSKAAVPFGARHRIIDYVLSNFVNSGIYALYVLVQYKSQSLIEHVSGTWRIGGRLPETFVTVVPPQMRMGGATWYQGTADAVFQNLNLIRDFAPEVVAVFGADHIYRMDLRHMIQFHLASRADVSIAALPVPLAEAPAFGVITAAPDGRITGFAEKPPTPTPMLGDPRVALGSMGNYVFTTDVLVDVLREDAARQTDHDFGRTIVPELVKRGRAFAYSFRDNRIPGVKPHEEPAYWRDVGAIRSYYEAQMDQLGAAPAFDLDNPRWPIFARSVEGPPARILSGDIEDSMFGEGCAVEEARIVRSILGRGVRVAPGAVIAGSIVMDHTEVGSDARVVRAIVDRYNKIPAGARLEPGSQDDVGVDIHRDASGILVVPRGEPPGPLPQAI